MIKEHYTQLIEAVAWELADATRIGPEDFLCDAIEVKLWEFSETDPAAFDELARHTLGDDSPLVRVSKALTRTAVVERAQAFARGAAKIQGEENAGIAGGLKNTGSVPTNTGIRGRVAGCPGLVLMASSHAKIARALGGIPAGLASVCALAIFGTIAACIG